MNTNAFALVGFVFFVLRLPIIVVHAIYCKCMYLNYTNSRYTHCQTVSDHWSAISVCVSKKRWDTQWKRYKKLWDRTIHSKVCASTDAMHVLQFSRCFLYMRPTAATCWPFAFDCLHHILETFICSATFLLLRTFSVHLYLSLSSHSLLFQGMLPVVYSVLTL